jgi:transposase-like protein
LTPKKFEFKHDVKMGVEARVRQGVKAVLEEMLQAEMSEHLKAGYRELPPDADSTTVATHAIS